MRDRLALTVGGVIAAAIAIDVFVFGGNEFMFVANKVSDFLGWFVFWR